MLALPGELDDAIGCLKAAGLEAVFASYTAAVARSSSFPGKHAEALAGITSYPDRGPGQCLTP
jgi:hypothetical protein